MTGIFAAATAVQRRSSATTGDGETIDTCAAVVQPGWDIGGNANCGYLLALAGRWPMRSDVPR